MGDVPGVNGNGTLAEIIFHVKFWGETALNLSETKLGDSNINPIEHSTVNGYCYVSTRDVAIIELTVSELAINVTVENQGACVETFNVSVYYINLIDPLVGVQTVTLEPGSNITLTFFWNPPTSGRYKIYAEASVVPGETDTADNTKEAYIYIQLNKQFYYFITNYAENLGLTSNFYYKQSTR